MLIRSVFLKSFIQYNIRTNGRVVFVCVDREIVFLPQYQNNQIDGVYYMWCLTKLEVVQNALNVCNDCFCRY